MIIGAHAILYSKDAEADRAFLRDMFGLPNVDVGGGWLMFGLPPAEVAVHPGERNDVHEFFLMCDDIEAFLRTMSVKGVACTPIQQQRWGALTSVALPGGGKLGVYQPFHARPKAMKLALSKSAKGAKKSKRAVKTRSAKTGARKTRTSGRR